MTKFIMLVGIPGAGKSTYAKKLLDANKDTFVWLSSDTIREELYGDENIQGNSAEVFSIMTDRTLKNLKEGISVIYDATNINRKNRVHLVNRLSKDVVKECHIVWARIEDAFERNNSRSRKVPEQVIKKMLHSFQTPFYDEGWDDIEVIFNSESYTLNDFLDDLNQPHDNPHHYGTIMDHIERVKSEMESDASQLSAEYDMCILRALAQYHDIGKPFTKSFINSKGLETEIAHYYDHQFVGAYIMLGLPVTKVNSILLSWLVLMHMDPFFNESKYFKSIAKNYRDIIFKFNEYDRRGA